MGEKELLSEISQRLDVFLREKLPPLVGSEVSNSKIRRLIMAGAVFVNGIQRRIPSFVLAKGARVRVRVDEQKLFFEREPDDIKFTLDQSGVLYEDEDIIVVNKPPFLPTEGTIVKSRASMHDAVVEYLWKQNPALRNAPYAGIMHRLDRETSGALLFTKRRTANAAVHDMFENRTARKIYRAVCFASEKFRPSAGESFFVENYIGRISAKSSRCEMGVVPQSRGGLYSRTEFYVAAEKDGLFYIDCELKTGRTHQIRVHLSCKGLPLAGDSLYGETKAQSFVKRVMLHSWKLEFPHPADGHKVLVEAPLPEGFSLPNCRF